jgi:RHS repeat-associated protein
VVDQIWEDYGTSGTLDEYDYTYDLAGNVLSRANTQNNALSEWYTFDGANRLTKVTEEPNGDEAVIKESWNLDGEGNLSAANAANELTASGCVYDKAGNLTADGTHTFKYDAWNRLVEVRQGSTVLAQYRYDGEGRRIVSIADTNADGTLDTATHYFFAGSQVVETRCGSPASDPSALTPEHQYVWSARGVDVAILRDAYTYSGSQVTDTRLYYLTDANGNVTALVNADGTPVERYSYSAYGKVTIYDANWQQRTGGSNCDNDRLFAGWEYDKATGLYYNRARWYNPATGSFLSRDPTGYAAGDANLYRYVANNPLSFTDPTGLSGSGGSGGSGGSSGGGVPAGSSGGTVVWDPGTNVRAAEKTGFRFDPSGHGGPHIQLGGYRWDARTLRPVKHNGITPLPLTESQLRELAKSGILKRIGKAFPDSVVREASEEVARELLRRGAKKAGAKAIAKAILRRIPVALILFAAEDYAEGGVEKAAKNVIIPGELIEEVAREAGTKLDRWIAESRERRYRERFGQFSDLPEFRDLQFSEQSVPTER